MMTNDFVQIGVVAKNEILKSVRGRKFLISTAIVFLVFLLITGLQMATNGWDNIKDIGQFMSVYFNMFPMVITLVVALLASVAIVSEFEERTALILFTRPIRRTSIFVGKILSCLIIEALLILAYYIMASIVAYVKLGTVPSDLLTSYGISILYAFAASGIAFIISSFFKKGSVCTIISVLILVIIIPISSSMIGSDDGENWYMLDQSADTLYTCVPEYVDQYNEMAEQFKKVVDSAITILEGFTDKGLDPAKDWLAEFIQSPDYLALDAEHQESILKMLMFLNTGADGNLKAMISVLKFMSVGVLPHMDYPDVGRATLVLLVWGIVSYFVAWVRFVRREF